MFRLSPWRCRSSRFFARSSPISFAFVVERLLRSCIDDGVAAGVFSVAYPADTARALLGMVQAVTTWYRPGGRLSPQTLADRYVDIAVQAVGARPR